MKRLFILLLLCCYLIPVMGVAMNFHFCKDRISSVSFLTFDSTKCSCEEMAGRKSCCHDEFHFFKVKSDQQAARNCVKCVPQEFQLTGHLIPVNHPEHAGLRSNVTYIEEYPPPPSGRVAVHALYCVFLV